MHTATTKRAAPPRAARRLLRRLTLLGGLSREVSQASPSPPSSFLLGCSAGADRFGARRPSVDGDDLGESTYSVPIKPDDVIHVNGGQKFRVLDVVPPEEKPLAGLLKVEAA